MTIFPLWVLGLIFLDTAIKKLIKQLPTASKGNLSTLNCSEEVILAEKLISMHPWSSKVKFARSGGEANGMSIRIAGAIQKMTNCLLRLSWMA